MLRERWEFIGRGRRAKRFGESLTLTMIQSTVSVRRRDTKVRTFRVTANIYLSPATGSEEQAQEPAPTVAGRMYSWPDCD